MSQSPENRIYYTDEFAEHSAVEQMHALIPTEVNSEREVAIITAMISSLHQRKQQILDGRVHRTAIELGMKEIEELISTLPSQ